MQGKTRACLGDGVEHHQITPRADWSAMLPDLLRIIAGLIDGIEDYIRFRAVCKHWNSAATFSSYDELPRSSKRRLEYPWLMLAPSNTAGDKRRGFYSLRTGKEFYLDFPEIQGKVCLGTPCGRLLTIDGDQNMHLFNPLTRQHLPLPPFTITDRFPYRLPSSWATMYVQRALVVWDDDTPIVFVNYWEHKLAMVRFGDASWTAINPSPFGPFGSTILTIELFRGQVLVLTRKKYHMSMIHMVDLSLSPPALNEFAICPSDYCDDKPIYLVDVGGDLHALDCNLKYPECKDYYLKQKFTVFKFNIIDKNWETVHTLRGWTAFVGRNSSFALPSSKNYPLCRPNCIYFTDDSYKEYDKSGGADWGIFRVEPKEGVEEEVEVKDSEEEVIVEWVDEDNEEYEGYDPDEEEDLNVMERCPFDISPQFSRYCPPLWLAPNMW